MENMWDPLFWSSSCSIGKSRNVSVSVGRFDVACWKLCTCKGLSGLVSFVLNIEEGDCFGKP